MACDCCRRSEPTQPVAQGPLELRLCDRCADDEFFHDAGLLRAFDQLQELVQTHVLGNHYDEISGRIGVEDGLDEPLAEAWQIVEASYPRACIAAGSTRLVVAFGQRVCAKLQWHHGLRDEHHGAVPTNIRQAACWLAYTDKQAQHLAPCLALSRGGVLWARRVRPIAPTYNPLDDRGVGSWIRIGVRTREAERYHGREILAARARLHAVPLKPGDSWRVNNWAWFEDRLVLADILPTVPDPEFDARFDEHAARLQARDGDVALDRAGKRLAVEAPELGTPTAEHVFDAYRHRTEATP